MVRINDISSTEKLLDLIRKKGAPDRLSAPPRSKKFPFVPPMKSIFKRSSPLKIVPKQGIHVGVDIGHEALRMVKMQRPSATQWLLMGYESVPLAPEIGRGTPEFINIIKNRLTSFCKFQKNISIWAIISSANVNVRHIRIPKIARSQVGNAVFWSLKRETPFNEQETLLDFEILDEIVEEGVSKWLIMTYLTPRGEVQKIKEVFVKAGLPLAGISIIPFAIQNIFRTKWIPVMEGNVASLFIGNDFSRIDIYSRGNLILTRGIKTGIKSMTEALLESLQDRERGKAGMDQETAAPVDPVDMEAARKVLFSLSPDSEPMKEHDVGFDLSEGMKLEIIKPALERLVRQVELTFEHVTTHVDKGKVDRLFVSSAMNVYEPMIAYAGEQLGIETNVLDPFCMASLPLGKECGTISLSEKVALLPALGIALSDNAHTPNLLFSFKDKQQASKMTRVNRIIVSVSVAATLVAVGILLYEFAAIERKQTELASLQHQLARYQPRIDKQSIFAMASASRTQKFSSGAYSERYRAMAVIAELSAITPPNVRLISLKTHLGAAPTVPNESPAAVPPPTAGKKETGDVTLDGIILGKRRNLESSLAAFIIQLQASPIFRGVIIQKNSIERFQERERLRFTIQVKLV